MIAAIRLHPRPIRINQKHFRRRTLAQRESRFEQNPPIRQNIRRNRARTHVSQRKHSFRSRRLNLPKRLRLYKPRRLQLKPLRRAKRVNKPPSRQIQRTNRIHRSTGHLPHLAVGQRHFPYLPRISRRLFRGKKQSSTIERHVRIRAHRKLRY